MPKPNSSISRALYADEIIVLNQFINPACVTEKFSPIHSPGQYKQETIKNVLLLMQLMPLIEAGIVYMIPDPCDFDYSLRKQTWDMARERLKNWKPSRKEFETMETFYKEDFMRSMWGLPEESLKRQIRTAIPQISDEEIEQAVKYIEEMRKLDPLALLQPMTPGEEKGQLQISRISPNLELGLFLAQVTGSFIYTDNRHRWGEILDTIIDSNKPMDANWELVVEKLAGFRLTFLDQVAPQMTLAIRRSGRLGNFRKVLRQIWTDVQSNLESEQVEVLTQRLINKLKDGHEKSQSEWKTIQKELHEQPEGPFSPPLVTVNGKINCKIPPAGFGLNTVYRLLLAHSGRTDYSRCMPMVVFIEFGPNY